MTCFFPISMPSCNLSVLVLRKKESSISLLLTTVRHSVNRDNDGEIVKIHAISLEYVR